MIIQNRRVRTTANQICESIGWPWFMFAPIPSDGRVLFYKRDRPSFGFLSNFWISPVHIDGAAWPHTEAWYQSQKSENPQYRQKILEKTKPSWAKYVGDNRIGSRKLARESWFREHPMDLRSDWDEVKLDVMRIAVRAKFTQNKNLGLALLQTGVAELIEDSSSDRFWGTGRDKNGTNWLGVVLMECRDQLSSSV